MVLVFKKIIMIKYIFLFLLFALKLHGQEITISGTVTSTKNVIPDAFIKISDKGQISNAITNDKGFFEFKKYKKQSDSLLFTVYKTGFLPFKKMITTNEQLDNINFRLLKDSINQLQEVTITSNSTINKSGKTIYKISSKDYLKNAKSDVALNSLPNVSIQEGNIMIDNRKKAIVFIDGIESSMEELKRLDVKDVNKIEVIYNPSASFGSENLGGVIQVITKKKGENFIKGELEAYSGVRLEARGILPSLSLKTKYITFKSFYSYSTNNQNIENELTRVVNNTVFNQYNYRKVKGWQDYFSSRIKLILNPKSSINISGNLYRYEFEGKSNGYYNNSVSKNFSIDDLEQLNKWSISSVYNYNFNPKSNIFIKFKYFDYKNKDQSKYIEVNETTVFNSIYSNSKETSSEIVFQKKAVQLFKLPLEYSIGYKSIFRRFNFQSNNFNFNQNINAIYVNTDIDFSANFSMSTSLTADFTVNKSQVLDQNYNFILPTISGLYKLSENLNLNLDYSRKITRPSGNYLNPDAIFYNPSFKLQGNINLRPQIRDLYEVSLSKQLKNQTSISAKIFNDYTKDAIIETFVNQNNIITNTYSNAGEVNIYGLNMGINTKIFHKILSVNINTGINYNDYNSNSLNTLIKQNKGYSFNSSVNLNTLIKNKISLTLNGNLNSPNYSLVSKSTIQPLLSFDAESTFFKENLNVRFSYTDMFGWRTKSIDNIGYNDFSQTIITKNKTTNFLLTLVYHFGKNFSDRFNNPIINNDDIKVK
jgi:ferric enterobactin receptor